MAARRPPAAPIRFGTSGWRGVLAREITHERLRAVAWAVAQATPGRRGAPRIAVAHDTRFLGEELARTAARVLRGAGARVVPVASPVPTPVVAHAVWRGRADAALVLTASHNPPEYHGVKVVAAGGLPAPPELTRRLERLAMRALARGLALEAPVRAAARDAVSPYLEWILGHAVAPGRPARGVAVLYDALHGTGAGVVDRALSALGARVTTCRTGRDAWFAGASPDPRPSRLLELRASVRRARRPTVGLATDGDADRLAVVMPGGRVLDEATLLALLVDHLAAHGRVRRGLAVTVATGSLPERVARAHGLPLERHPIGFKHLAAALAAERADVAGDESGGFALAACGVDKDAIVTACLVAEMEAAPGGIEGRLRALVRRHGRWRWGRAGLPASPERRRRLARLAAAPPRRLGDARVVSVSRADGLRLDFDDGFLLWRASGTEPLVRIYAEARSEAALARRLAAGARRLGARRVDEGGASG